MCFHRLQEEQVTTLYRKSIQKVSWCGESSPSVVTNFPMSWVLKYSTNQTFDWNQVKLPPSDVIVDKDSLSGRLVRWTYTVVSKENKDGENEGVLRCVKSENRTGRKVIFSLWSFPPDDLSTEQVVRIRWCGVFPSVTGRTSDHLVLEIHTKGVVVVVRSSPSVVFNFPCVLSFEVFHNPNPWLESRQVTSRRRHHLQSFPFW